MVKENCARLGDTLCLGIYKRLDIGNLKPRQVGLGILYFAPDQTGSSMDLELLQTANG